MIPTVVAPTYELKLHSLPKPVKYRPYLVKEEKILLMAMEGQDEGEVTRAVKQIIEACTFGAVDVDKLPFFDMEMLFLNLRAKSVNNVIELRYECKNVPTPKEGELPLEDGTQVCRNQETIKINLDDIRIAVPKDHTRKIMVTDTIGCVMRYPTSKHVQIFKDLDTVDAVTLIAECIETVFTDKGETYETADSKPEEVLAFVESLSLAQVNAFRPFFETMPSVSHTFEFQCSKCGYTEQITLTGLMDFFG
jgi:hypothetical protein